MSWDVYIVNIDSDKIAITLSCGKYNNIIRQKVNHIHINIEGKTFYLLSIEIDNCFRGKGYGSELYNFLVEMARYIGCNRIVQTPSGKTYTGETREDYLKRRGWQSNGVIAWIDLN